MSSAKALKKKIAKRAKQKKNIQVKNSIRLKQKAEPSDTQGNASDDGATTVTANTTNAAGVLSDDSE